MHGVFQGHIWQTGSHAAPSPTEATVLERVTCHSLCASWNQQHTAPRTCESNDGETTAWHISTIIHSVKNTVPLLRKFKKETGSGHLLGTWWSWRQFPTLMILWEENWCQKGYWHPGGIWPQMISAEAGTVLRDCSHEQTMLGQEYLEGLWLLVTMWWGERCFCMV